MQAEPPDLVMLDIQMPDMDGYEVCRELKADPATRDVPVIFISALDDVTVKVRAFKTGGIDYVTKPFQAEEVLARVESQLQIARLRKDLEASKRDLERRNGELVAANEALALANRRADRVFSALSEALPGILLDKKYRLEEKIGAGGFGVVYRAEHVGLKRPVAVKVFRPTPGNDSGEGLSRFEREGISACRVNHPNAIAVLDSGLSPAGSAYIVMELLEGRTLAEEMGESGPFALERAVAIAAPMCDALAAAHEAGIVHRDVKPENVFLHRGRDGEVVKVLDFGLAKVVGDETAAGQGASAQPSRSLVGTPAYIAPERLWGNPYDGRADVYSVGVVLYHMLCGEPPFRVPGGGFHALIALSVTRDPRPLREHRPDVDAGAEAVVMRALARDPAARPTAGELARGLREVLGGR
jgi:serine/threonine protein kinase